jgi:hypothetical protein
MNSRKISLIVASFIFTLVSAQYVWAQQRVSIVDQEGTVKVKVKNIPGVQIDPKEPFQEEWGPVPINQFGLLAVPIGKRAVIEFVSFSTGTDALPLSRVVGCSVRTTIDGISVEHRFNPGSPLPPGGGYGVTHRVNEAFRLYSDGGTTIGVICLNANTTGEYFASVSGYYTSAP